MPFERDVPLIKQCKYWFDWIVQTLAVADAQILGLTTIRGTNTTTAFTAMILARPCAENLTTARRQAAEAMVAAMNAQVFGATEALSNTAIAAADTVNGVRALFNTQVSSLSATASDLVSHGTVPFGALSPTS